VENSDRMDLIRTSKIKNTNRLKLFYLNNNCKLDRLLIQDVFYEKHLENKT